MLWITSALAAEVTLFEAGPPTLHPLYAETPVDNRAQELVFDWLFYYSPRTGKLVSPLVREQQLSPDGRELTLLLRDDVTWHDGEHLDANDVCFTIAAIRDPATPSRLAQRLRRALVGCTVQKDRAGDRAVIRFAEVYTEPRAHLVFAVLPQHRFGGTALLRTDAFARAPIGTGPMRVEIEKSSLRYVPFPNPHHDQALLSSPDLRVVVQGDPLLQVRTLLKAPRTLGMLQVPPPYRPDLAASDAILYKSHAMRSWWFVALDTREGPTREVHVRRALAATLDRERLIELTLGFDPADVIRAPQLLSGPFVPASPYYNREVPQAQPEPERAAEEMREAGAVREEGGKRWMLEGEPVRLKVGVHAALEVEARGLGMQLATQLREGGFEVELFSLTSQDWLDSVQTGKATQYDALVGQWSFGMVEEVSDLFHTRQGEQGSLNLLGYSNAQVDEQLQRSDQARDDAEAIRANHALHALLAEDLPYLFLWQQDSVSAWQSSFFEAGSPLPFLSDRPAWAQVLPYSARP